MVQAAPLGAFVACLVLALLVSSQAIVAPSCTEPYYDWANNSLHQSPCTMAAYAIAACNGGAANITALQTPFSVYTGPTNTSDAADACKCNTVSYSLISACAGCQGAQWLPFSTFVTNCSATIPKGQFAPGIDIPAGTAFPAWAYDPLNSNSFNNATAYDIFLHNTTEFTHSGTSNTNGTASSSASTSSSKSHAGAIAGGVVGGVVGLALIGLLAFFLIRRRRRAGASDVATGEKRAQGTPGAMSSIATEPMSPRRFYDPSDPSTFPDAIFNDRNGSSVGMSSPAPVSTTNVSANHSAKPSWGSSDVGSVEKGPYHPGLPEV
ncbi:hypothetical protein PENSPDRAFT_648938 [Peniophora sp. CONT]|nr:hypothetical protein PENSPDRAFT_648938 [Peniophora sp. CONT]